MCSRTQRRGSICLPGGEDLMNGWRPLFRQFGTQLVALPIFHAYALLAKLGPERIAVDGMWPGTPVRAFATRRGHAQAQVVLYYFDEANQHSVGEARDVDLTVRGLAGATESSHGVSRGP